MFCHTIFPFVILLRPLCLYLLPFIIFYLSHFSSLIHKPRVFFLYWYSAVKLITSCHTVWFLSNTGEEKTNEADKRWNTNEEGQCGNDINILFWKSGFLITVGQNFVFFLSFQSLISGLHKKTPKLCFYCLWIFSVVQVIIPPKMCYVLCDMFLFIYCQLNISHLLIMF